MRHLTISITSILTLLFSITADAAEDKALLERLKSQYGSAIYIIPDNYDYIMVGNSNTDNLGIYNAETGKMIIPPIFFHITLIDFEKPSGTAWVATSKSKWGCIDKSGNLIAPFIFDEVKLTQLQNRDYDGLCTVKIDGKVGAVDKYGKIVIPCKFDDIELEQYAGLRQVVMDGLHGAINNAGKVVIPCKYDDISLYQLADSDNGNLCEVELDGLIGAVDNKGKLIIPCKYEYINLEELANPKFKGMFTASIDRDQGYGITNLKGDILVPFKYSHIELEQWVDPDYGGFCEVNINYKKGVIDKNGNLVIPCRYDEVTPFLLADPDNGGICDVKIGGKYGATDISGEIDIPCEFDFVGSHWFLIPGNISGLCNVRTDNKWGLVDKKGNIIVPCIADDEIFIPSQISPTLFSICIDHKFGIIDNSGSIIVPCSYEGIWIEYIEELITYKIDGKQGIMDLTGKIIVDPIYDTIGNFEDGVAQVTLNGVTSLLTNPLKGTNLVVANSLTANATVDKNIPVSKNKSTETFAFIVANEEYAKWDASYALNDGKVFRDYCEKRMGIPATNIKLYENATYGTFRSMMGKMRDIADVYDGDARIILYFAGLGTQADNEQFLLPVDASLTNIKATGISVRQLLDELSAMNTAGTVIITDAAFNGRDRRGEPLGEHRGVAIKTIPQQPKGNVAWLTATSDARNALASENLNHGIFTYYLLDTLQKSVRLTFDNLTGSVTDNVKKHTLKSEEIQIPKTIKSDIFTDSNF